MQTKISTMPADALTPYVARSSTAMILINQVRIGSMLKLKKKKSALVLIQPSSGTCRTKYISPIVEILQNFCYSKSLSIDDYKICT